MQEEIKKFPSFSFREFFSDTETFFGIEVYNGITYLIFIVCLAYIYHPVFQNRRLPLLKMAIVYILLALGAFLLLIFQVDMGLPIMYCLISCIAHLIVPHPLLVAGKGGKQATKMDDVLFNLATRLKIVYDHRPDDRAAKDTLDFFEMILKEDHHLERFEIGAER